MRYLNGFVLIGVILLGLSVAGLASNNRVLAEPGQRVNSYAWLLYLAAAAIMLVNGAVSIWSARRADEEAARKKAAAEPAPTHE